ncbi:MAG: glycosyl hydrolase [Leptospiraceae bacterium]|nr:glycosyl hydrolase [Leptospiraceae bacterium]
MSRKKTGAEPTPETENPETTPSPEAAETTPQPWWLRFRLPIAIAGLVIIAGTPFAMRLAHHEPQAHIDKPTDQPVVAIQQSTKSGPLKASTWSTDYKVMLQYAELYDELHPFIYSLKGRHNNPPELASGWGHTQKLERVKALRAKNPKLKIIPTIFRWENPGEKINEVIGMGGRKDIRDKHIQHIIHEVETYGYDGIDIDYEGMSCGKKEKFEEFIILLSGELKKRNKLLSVAVHPKTASEAETIKKKRCGGLKNPIVMDFREDWRGPLTHDYAFLGKHADMVKIMAYELHPRKYRNPGPGPQAPGTWLAEIIDYARDKIPAEKLYMAIPTYGYDWGLNCRAPIKAVYYSDVQRIRAKEHKLQQPTDIGKILASEKGAKSWTNLRKFRDIHDEKVYEDPSLWYNSGGCKRVAFFMDKTAFSEKMALLQKSNLAGFSFWQLTKDNDPEIQQFLSTSLKR